MTTHAASNGREFRAHDTVASLTLAAVALVALAAAWVVPWWAMEARAPQYGQRVLVVSVNPRTVQGDVFEVDTLGHYVGIQPIAHLAPVERKLAPFGLAAAILGLAAVAWLPRRSLRLLAVSPAVVMPAIFLADLNYWMSKSVSERDLDAALNLTITSVEPKLLGDYELGQFKITARADEGLYLAATAALLGIGLAFAAPLPFPSRRRRGAAAAAASAALLVAVAAPAPARAAAIDASRHPSLAAAIEAAAAGDDVLVPPGVHRERLVVGKSIRLLGAPGAILDGGAEGTVLTVTAPDTEVRDLTVRASGTSYTTEDAGIRIENAPLARVAGVRVEDALFGIYVLQSGGCRIEDSTVVGKDLPPERRGDGIRLWYSNDCAVRRNRVERSRDVIIWHSSGTQVEDNQVTRSRYGLHYMYSDHNVFRRNRFDDNQVGATIMYSTGVELSGNSFSFSNGPGGYGFLVKESNDVFIVGNRFVGNATALFFDDSPQARKARAEVRRNLIARNDVGIAIQPHTRRIQFSENSLLGNRVQVTVLGTGTADGCAWSAGGRGNHWSDAVVYDGDRDGVSEIPYRAESTYEALADRHPVLAFFDGTPGADAIDLAARLFPIFQPRPKLTDPHPLAAPVLEEWMRNPDSAGSAPGRAAGLGLAGAGAALAGAAALGLIAARWSLA